MIMLDPANKNFTRLKTSIEKNCKFLKNNRLVSTAIFDDTIIFPEKQNVGL